MDSDVPSPVILSVGEFTRRIRDLIEEEIGGVLVRGEVSNFKRHFSGHCYFTLKDKDAQVSCVMFRREAGRLRFELEDGLEVIAGGRATVYEPRGQYQLVLDTLEPAGLGTLQLAFEQLKEKLSREGLFDKDRKRPLPAFPGHIGVVTSTAGAALRDFLKVATRRFAGLEILIVPTPVQGPEAAPGMIRGIEILNRIDRIDVIVLCRGGGSMEDLWAFNDESLARTIAASSKPVITGVGHETDFTIADFVADFRAPTPSSAAELVVGAAEEVLYRLKTGRERLVLGARAFLNDLKNRVALAARGLPEPRTLVRDRRVRLDELSGRLVNAFRSLLNVRRETTGRLSAHLEALSPLATLRRGYAVVLTVPGGRVVKDAKRVRPGEEVTVRLARGALSCLVRGRPEDPLLPLEDDEGP